MVNKITSPVTPIQQTEKINEIIDNLGGGGGGSSRNIGEIVASTIPLTDAGLHLLDGSVIQGGGAYDDFVTYIAGLVSNYPDLFTTEANWQSSVSTYGVCGKFVYTSGSPATVRLPKITGFVEGTTDVTALGDLIEAGLPNITGQFEGLLNHASFQTSGAFSSSEDSGSALSGYVTNDGNYKSKIQITSFSAQNSNSIYGNSSTVQPQSIKVLYYICIATSTKTNIEVDIDEVMTDLNGKADKDLENAIISSTFATKLNSAGIRTVVETYVNGTSWYRVYSDGWCEQGGYNTTNNQNPSIALLKSMGNTNYSVQITVLSSSYGEYMGHCVSTITSDSSFSVHKYASGWGIIWQACGYIS